MEADGDDLAPLAAARGQHGGRWTLCDAAAEGDVINLNLCGWAQLYVDCCGAEEMKEHGAAGQRGLAKID